MTITFRATTDFVDRVRADIGRPHPFAFERVGFISVRAALGHENLVLLAQAYHPVADADYIADSTVGAKINADAIRKALNIALLTPVGMFHVHVHHHDGAPRFSRVDLADHRSLIPDFFNVRPAMPHGAIVFSHDMAEGRCWLGRDKTIDISEFHLVGRHSHVQRRK